MAGFGAGALVSAVSFDLVEQARAIGAISLTVWLLVGAVIFIAGDRVVERRFGDKGVGGALGIVLGSVVDGIPESLIFGIGVAAGGPVGLGFLAAVIVSNIPQALAPSVDLYHAGWSRPRLSMLWGAGGARVRGGRGPRCRDRDADPGHHRQRVSRACGGGAARDDDGLADAVRVRARRRSAGFWTVVGFALAVAPSLM